MRENTPPASPFHEEDDELIYVGDNIDDVIEQLEEYQGDEPIEEDGKMIHPSDLKDNLTLCNFR